MFCLLGKSLQKAFTEVLAGPDVRPLRKLRRCHGGHWLLPSEHVLKPNCSSSSFSSAKKCNLFLTKQPWPQTAELILLAPAGHHSRQTGWKKKEKKTPDRLGKHSIWHVPVKTTPRRDEDVRKRNFSFFFVPYSRHQHMLHVNFLLHRRSIHHVQTPGCWHQPSRMPSPPVILFLFLRTLGFLG